MLRKLASLSRLIIREPSGALIGSVISDVAGALISRFLSDVGLWEWVEVVSVFLDFFGYIWVSTVTMVCFIFLVSHLGICEDETSSYSRWIYSWLAS